MYQMIAMMTKTPADDEIETIVTEALMRPTIL
jgi:hypothetical protein